MEDVLELTEADYGVGILVLVDRIGFEEDECIREPTKTIWRDIPDFIWKKLRKMRPSTLV